MFRYPVVVLVQSKISSAMASVRILISAQQLGDGDTTIMLCRLLQPSSLQKASPGNSMLHGLDELSMKAVQVIIESSFG